MPDTNPPVETKFAMPDPNAAPLNLIQLFELANRLVSSEIKGSYKPYVVRGIEPGAEDRDKLWLQLNAQGQPIALKYFWPGSSSWRRVWNGMPGQISGFSGDPGYGAPPKNFNQSGLGNEGGFYDGWAICNGQNGTPDLSDQFIIGAHMNNAGGKEGWDGTKWVTWISNKNAEQTGGVRDFTLTEETTFRPATSEIKFRHWTADGNIPDPHTGSLYGVKAGPANEVDNDVLVPGDEGNETPTSVSTIPPFYALAWIQFTGYR